MKFDDSNKLINRNIKSDNVTELDSSNRYNKETTGFEPVTFRF